MRAKSLLAEQATLEASHVEAANGAILEREERIRQKLASDARMNAVLKTAADGIIVTDDSGVIETFNAAAQAIFGYHAVEVVGKCLATLLPLLDQEADTGAAVMPIPISGHSCAVARRHRSVPDTLIADAADRSQDIRREVEGLRKDGTTCPLELAISTACVENRQLFTVIVRDITKRKRAEEELRRLHLQNRMILNCAGEGIFGVDRQGTVSFANPAAGKLLGWRPEELIGKPHHATFYHTQRDGTPFPPENSPIGKTIEDGGGSPQRNGPVLEKGRHELSRRVHLYAAFRREREGAGRRGHVLGHHRAEAAGGPVAQAQKLESIGQLAAGIAHEINTPSQYIGDNTRFLREAFASLRPLLVRCLELPGGAAGRTAHDDCCQALVSSMEQADLEFLLKEIPAAIDQSLEGIEPRDADRAAR